MFRCVHTHIHTPTRSLSPSVSLCLSLSLSLSLFLSLSVSLCLFLPAFQHSATIQACGEACEALAAAIGEGNQQQVDGLIAALKLMMPPSSGAEQAVGPPRDDFLLRPGQACLLDSLSSCV